MAAGFFATDLRKRLDRATYRSRTHEIEASSVILSYYLLHYLAE